jgi:hypothetical protein
VACIVIDDALPNTLCSTAEPFLLKLKTANVIGFFRTTAVKAKMKHLIKTARFSKAIGLLDRHSC